MVSGVRPFLDGTYQTVRYFYLRHVLPTHLGTCLPLFICLRDGAFHEHTREGVWWGRGWEEEPDGDGGRVGSASGLGDAQAEGLFCGHL